MGFVGIYTKSLLQDYLEDATIATWFHEQHIELNRIQDAKVEFSYHASLTFSIAKVDRMNRDFFVAHRECMPRTHMRAIRDASGLLVIDPECVMDVATDFYVDLFVAEPVLDKSHTTRAHVWSFT